MLHINTYQLHKYTTMQVPTAGSGCFFDFEMSLLRAAFELLILKLLCHGPREARQILPVMKYHLGEMWVLSGSFWWRHFNISLSFSINISSKGVNEMRNQNSLSLCVFIMTLRVSATGKRYSTRAWTSAGRKERFNNIHWNMSELLNFI